MRRALGPARIKKSKSSKQSIVDMSGKVDEYGGLDCRDLRLKSDHSNRPLWIVCFMSEVSLIAMIGFDVFHFRRLRDTYFSKPSRRSTPMPLISWWQSARCHSAHYFVIISSCMFSSSLCSLYHDLGTCTSIRLRHHHCTRLHPLAWSQMTSCPIWTVLAKWRFQMMCNEVWTHGAECYRGDHRHANHASNRHRWAHGKLWQGEDGDSWRSLFCGNQWQHCIVCAIIWRPVHTFKVTIPIIMMNMPFNIVVVSEHRPVTWAPRQHQLQIMFPFDCVSLWFIWYLSFVVVAQIAGVTSKRAAPTVGLKPMLCAYRHSCCL